MFDHNNVENPHGQEDFCPEASPRPTIRPALFCGALAFAAIASMPRIASADEGGVSFWLPGAFGSLAAAPQQPGWSLANLYYHTFVSGGGDVSLEREFELRRIPAGVSLSARLSASLGATADLEAFIPTYVFATPVLGGQLAASMMGVYGSQSANINGTLSGTLSAGPFTMPFMRSDSINGFPFGNMQGFLNLKAYFEWDNHDRPAGWNGWVTFAVSPPAPPAATPPPSRRPMIYK